MQDNTTIPQSHYWTDRLSAQLVGKTIVQVRYSGKDAAEQSNWVEQGIELVLSDGTVLVPLANNEASAPGALSVWFATEEPVEIVAPTLPLDNE